MPNRNEPLIREIVEAINLSREQEKQLFKHFDHRLIADVGSVRKVVAFAEVLRLAITEEEASQALDLIALRQMCVITTDQVDEVVNDLFPDRFIEP